MRNIILTLLLALSIATYATKVTAGKTGGWKVDGTWDLSSPEKVAYDTIVIPSGITIRLYTSSTVPGSMPVYIILEGTLKFGTNDGLTLPSGSAISVSNGGEVTGKSGSTIEIGGTTVWSYNIDGPSTGPDYIAETGTSLPVELLSFVSKLKNHKIELLWQTASEINSEYFEIERSADGENWEVITKLQGAGNSNVLLDYSYIDNNPMPGANYYRLHQVDYDGKDEYFGPIYQNYENASKGELKIYPNPNTDGQLTVSIAKPMQYGDEIEIYDIAGRLQFTYQVSDDRNSLQLNISELKKGMYILRYQSSEEQFSSRLIVQ